MLPAFVLLKSTYVSIRWWYKMCFFLWVSHESLKPLHITAPPLLWHLGQVNGPCRGQFWQGIRRKEWDPICKSTLQSWNTVLTWDPVTKNSLSSLPHLPTNNIPKSETRVLINWTFWWAHIKDNHLEQNFRTHHLSKN